VLAVFIVAYIVLRLMGGYLTRQVRQTAALSSLDRVLGFGVGLIRGLVALGAFSLLINAATPPERVPAWISHAKLWPVANAAGAVMRTAAPDGLRVAHAVAPSMRDALGATDRGAPNPRDRGYDDNQRKSLDDLVEKSR
jgi:membrane protein required for colicin V production